MRRRTTALLGGLSLVVALVAVAQAQNINVTAPTHSFSDSFYENLGVGFQFDNGSFAFGFQPNAVPPFGGYDPNNDARFGFKAGPLSFNIFGSQGSRRSVISQTPTLTVMNGGTGYFFDGQLQPFVTGFVPVVGGAPPFAAQPTVTYPDLWQRWSASQTISGGKAPPPPPARRQAESRAKPVSSAQRGDISVAEIRRQRASSKVNEVEQLLAQARSAAAEQKWSLAENHLRNAMRRADASSRSMIASELNRVVARKKRPQR